MTDPKVSIVVAIYKSEAFLPKLINSLINQTYKNIEIILIDDGSPDRSGSICDQYKEKDSRIKVVHETNNGCCAARNAGINLATGEYLVIVDGDDWLAPDCVEYLLNIAISTKSDMALTDNIFTSRNQEQINFNDKIEIWSPEEATKKLIYPYMEIGPWNKIYKIDVLKKNSISFSVPWSGEGLYFITTFAQHSNHIGVGHRKVYYYRLNNINSGLTHYNVIMGINALANIKGIGENLYIDTPGVRKAVEWHIWKNYNFLLMLILATKSKKKYKKEYRTCLWKIRELLIPVVIKSELPLRHKFKMIVIGLFPSYFAKRNIKIKDKELKKDLVISEQK